MDEVDPGSGGSETVDPVALSSTSEGSPPAPRKGGMELEGEGEGGVREMDDGEKEKGRETLRERFVRASSPRIELAEGEDRSGEGEGLDGGKEMEM